MFEETIRKYGFITLMLTLVFSLFFADGGVLGYIMTKREISKINTEIQKLEKENIALINKMEKLQKDDEFLEEMVRTKYGLLREGERLYMIENEK